MSEENKIGLSTLSPEKGSRKGRRRIGRGEASGWGKTAGKGAKGQNARSGGGVRPGFEGGQTAFYRRIPKWGFFSRKRILGKNKYNTINLDTLNKFDDGATVDFDVLKEKGWANTAKFRAGVKVLGNGTLEKKLTVRVQAVTKSAQAQIEEKGGTVEILAVPKNSASTEEVNK